MNLRFILIRAGEAACFKEMIQSDCRINAAVERG